MKRSFILLLIIILIINSCIKEKAVTTSFIVKNLSDYHVDLLIFGFEDNLKAKVDTIFNIPTDSQIKVCYGGTLGTSVYNFPFGIDVDSAFIVFENLRRTIYRRENISNRNILNIQSYTGGKIDDDYYEYIYSIINEDFNNAIPIEE